MAATLPQFVIADKKINHFLRQHLPQKIQNLIRKFDLHYRYRLVSFPLGLTIMPFTKVKHFFLFGQTSFPETYFEQINNYIYLTGHFNIKIYDMLYS